MEVVKPQPLSAIFIEEPAYAWELLDCEVLLETESEVDGKDIARLLSLYMRGVEKLNSLQDRRESFFQQRMTALMMKPSVVKVLFGSSKAPDNPGDKRTESRQIKAEPKISMNYYQKRKEMEMQIQYSSDTDNLKKLLAQHNSKAETVQHKISQVIEQGKSKLEERIRAKKMKAQSVRSESCNNGYNSPLINKGSKELIIINEETRSRRSSRYSGRRYSLSLEDILESAVEEPKNSQNKRKMTDDTHKS